MSYVLANTKVVNVTESAVIINQNYDVSQADTVAYQLHYTDATPAAKTFVAANVNPTANTITITAHGFSTGLKVALTGTNLPGGLSATTYWIIVVDADTIKVATSLANATAGTPVDITTAGTTSDATLTPAALATTGAVIKLQQSNDASSWFDVSGLTVTVTAAGDTLWLVTAPPTYWHRIVVTPTTGALTLFVQACVRAIVNQ